MNSKKINEKELKKIANRVHLDSHMHKSRVYFLDIDPQERIVSEFRNYNKRCSLYLRKKFLGNKSILFCHSSDMIHVKIQSSSTQGAFGQSIRQGLSFHSVYSVRPDKRSFTMKYMVKEPCQVVPNIPNEQISLAECTHRLYAYSSMVSYFTFLFSFLLR